MPTAVKDSPASFSSFFRATEYAGKLFEPFSGSLLIDQ
jgi:hypothetical protein